MLKFLKEKRFTKEYLFKELFYTSAIQEDGHVVYSPSSRKFWAALSQIAFFGSLFLKFIVLGFFGIIAYKWEVSWLKYAVEYGNDNVLTTGMIGILAGQAVAAMGWYTARSAFGKEVQNAIMKQDTEEVKEKVEKGLNLDNAPPPDKNGSMPEIK